MTVEVIVLAVSVLAIFVFGVFMGYRLSERRVAGRTRRQVAVQSSLYRQLRELQPARQKGYSVRMQKGNLLGR
jgi:hypothetical protein